jgi:cytochrome c oxidase assembly factor CtaG
MPLHVHVASAPWDRTLWLPAVLASIALLYLHGRGWRRSTFLIHGRDWGAPGFLGGLLVIWTAMGSPLAMGDEAMLTVHMVQHLLLMTIAPPLILLSAPVLALVRGLPGRPPGRQLRRFIAERVDAFATRGSGPTYGQLTVCWLAATATLAIWHVPAPFALAWRSGEWHLFEQISFVIAGLLFWWPIVQPWPSAPVGPRWSLVLYLFLATLPCDILSGFLVFSDRVAYAVYLSPSPQSYAAVLADQQRAGALMWTCVTLIYLVCGAVLSTQLLSPQMSPAMSRHREGV